MLGSGKDSGSSAAVLSSPRTFPLASSPSATVDAALEMAGGSIGEGIGRRRPRGRDRGACSGRSLASAGTYPVGATALMLSDARAKGASSAAAASMVEKRCAAFLERARRTAASIGAGISGARVLGGEGSSPMMAAM